MTEVLRLDWLTDADVFAVRQRAREVAAAVGLDGQDQIRLATALSEVGREVLSPGPGTAVFRLLDLPARLVVEISTPRRCGAEAPVSIVPAGRLLDSATVTVQDGRMLITLEKHLPWHVMPGARELVQLQEALRGGTRNSAVEELRVQNADLLETLDQLTQRQHDLTRLNAELEETNSGVMAMYKQLADELEETNRGVVALYAELDEKGRQLLEATDTKARFLRHVSHELRAPVSSILGLADLLAEGRLDAEQRRQIGYLRGSARSLLDLVNELLDLARADSDRLAPVPTDISLGTLFGELRGTMRPLAQERGIDLVVEEPEVAEMCTDSNLLARVLRNLLANALSFTVTGEVRMRAVRRESGHHVEITVSDTGVGIAPEHQERVFEEFFQVPGPLQVHRAGTGLGLPYARHVTEALGGTLALQSAVGLGSTFTVTLPIGSPDDPDPEPVEKSVGHILVVDDDAAFRHVVRGMLQGVASRVSEAADGAEALAAVAAHRPDVVLLDLRMPNLDGGEVLRRLRADVDPFVRRLPVVLLTSAAIDAGLRRVAAPADAVLSKTEMGRATLVRAITAVARGGTRSASEAP